MASKIETGSKPAAHAVIHAFTVQAQQIANQTGRRIGMIYDLTADRIGLLEIKDDGVEMSLLFRVVSPQSHGMGEPSIFSAFSH